MNTDMLFCIQAPASTANLGPGFDSIGLALNLYLTVDVYEHDHWFVQGLSENMRMFPDDESNFIVRMAQKTAGRYGVTLPPVRLDVRSEIPLARGLGSSASAIVAGIELADQLGDLRLMTEEKVHLASLEEGHPDNAAASLLGGLVVGEHTEEETRVLNFSLPDMGVVVVIPEYELLTSNSREVLPASFSYQDAVKSSAVANTLLAALLAGQYELAGKMMKRDQFHQPYRRQLVPLLDEVEQTAISAGAFGVALSGAGPTIACFARTGKLEQLEEGLRLHFRDCSVRKLAIDYDGCSVIPHPAYHG
ncbi:MAG: homoserine kinase [Bacillus sp. (in: firmicutes)]